LWQRSLRAGRQMTPLARRAGSGGPAGPIREWWVVRGLRALIPKEGGCLPVRRGVVFCGGSGG
jgi:hypothetical protein